MLKLEKVFVVVLCFILIPVLSIYLGLQGDLIMVNYSVLMYQKDTMVLGLVWSLLASFGLNYTLVRIGNLDKRRGLLIAMFMFMSTRFPYIEEHLFFNVVHVAWGYMSVAIFNIHLYLAYRNYRDDILLKGYVLLVVTCALLIVTYGGITGLVELIYTSCVAILIGIGYTKKYLQSDKS
ncbi:MAG: hypothetical protein HUJ56_05610 [Erysipelotrichaceae bacterium]|nr:hypothetical protein [Erysipelotrichaceae bacterium]